MHMNNRRKEEKRMKMCRALTLAGLLLAIACAGYADTGGQPVKWSQLPDMVGGLDYSSETKVPSIVAADFLCEDGRPISDVHFWGSYWQTGIPTPPDGSPNSNGFLNAPAGGIEKFVLKWWSDVPVGQTVPFSHPGDLLATVEAIAYNEVFYGATTAGKEVWQYDVYLASNEWFEQQQGQIYWLSIEAVMANPDKQWGWHESKDHWNDDATQIYKGSPWYELVNNTYSVDMAFELTTVPEPSSMIALLGGLGSLLALKRRRG